MTVHYNGLRFVFFCPACQLHHSWDDRWVYNGNPDRPTVWPAIHNPATGCHLLIVDGRIQYLGDCAHHLAYKVVELPLLSASGVSPLDGGATRL